jgi:tRNA pseudouridine38-40 synthase
VRIALGLEYHGGAFCGWQSQANRCGVQDALEYALAAIAGHKVTAVTAGRTDAGVHALEQVVHFDTTVERPLSAWQRGVNANLPEKIAVLWASCVADDFHARFSAVSRSYRYWLLNRPTRPGLATGLAGWYHGKLDAIAMHEAAQRLLGEHDFSAFRAAECQAKTPVRTLFAAQVRRTDEHIVFDFRANAFLHHMVRNIVGSLIYVGNGEHPPEHIERLLESRDRAQAAPTFAPDGLYLVRVDYEPRWQLPYRRTEDRGRKTEQMTEGG